MGRKGRKKNTTAEQSQASNKSTTSAEGSQTQQPQQAAGQAPPTGPQPTPPSQPALPQQLGGRGSRVQQPLHMPGEHGPAAGSQVSPRHQQLGGRGSGVQQPLQSPGEHGPASATQAPQQQKQQGGRSSRAQPAQSPGQYGPAIGSQASPWQQQLGGRGSGVQQPLQSPGEHGPASATQAPRQQKQQGGRGSRVQQPLQSPGHHGPAVGSQASCWQQQLGGRGSGVQQPLQSPGEHGPASATQAPQQQKQQGGRSSRAQPAQSPGQYGPAIGSQASPWQQQLGGRGSGVQQPLQSPGEHGPASATQAPRQQKQQGGRGSRVQQPLQSPGHHGPAVGSQASSWQQQLGGRGSGVQQPLQSPGEHGPASATQAPRQQKQLGVRSSRDQQPAQSPGQYGPAVHIQPQSVQQQGRQIKSPEISPAQSPRHGTPSSQISGTSTKPPNQGDKGGAGEPHAVAKPVQHLSSGGGDGLGLHNKISKGGSAGRPVQVYVNQFELNLGKLKIVHQYDVAIDPDRPKKFMRIVMEQMRNLHYKHIHPAYDGSKLLYAATRLPKDEYSETIKLQTESREIEFKVKIKKVQEVDLTLIHRYYSQIQNNTIEEPPHVILQVIDVVLRHSLAMTRICVGNSLFSAPSRDRVIRLGNGMHMYRGMYQSAILGWKPFLNVDVANKAFPSAVGVVELISEFSNGAPLTSSPPVWALEKLKKHLKCLKIRYEIPKNPSSKRIYTVNDIVSSSLDYKFDKDGRMVNIVQYYKTDKNYNIMYPYLPVLWVGSMKSKIHVPAELCTVMPDQAVNRKCDPDQTRAMIRECATNTDVRKNDILYNVTNANYNTDTVVKEFGFSVNTNLTTVEARILDPPLLRYRNDYEKVSKGVWNPKIFVTSGQIKNGWTILSLDNYVRPQEIESLKTLAMRTGQTLGLDMATGFRQNDRRVNIMRNFQQELRGFFEGVKREELDLVVVILPNKDNIYNIVKETSEIAVGCLTQCIKSFTVQRKMNEATMKNILLKLNAKLNGSNHNFAKLPKAMAGEYVMIMGADVTHPSPDTVNGFSVAAVTASHDPNAFKYNITWRLQKPGKEMIEDMQNITREHLMYFYTASRGIKPTKLIYFRDGVSTGQFKEVLQSELTAIRNACTSLGPDYQPKITFIVVQKRHHTRFFPVDKRISQDRNMNVPAGTVVDKVVVHPTRQDFYLVSHASIQGVAKPTKYVTLWDDSNISDDDLEELTYHLCHMFTRCTRSVSYPAPTYYAHLAAARGKAYCDARRINPTNLEREQRQLVIKDDIVKRKPMFFV